MYLRRLCLALPVWLLIVGMWYGVSLNVSKSLPFVTDAQSLSADGFPVAPEIAFSWMQVFAQGLMAVIMTWALWVLLDLNKHVQLRRVYIIGVFRTLALLTVLAFSVPPLWNLLWLIGAAMRGLHPVDIANPHHLVLALCVVYSALLCLWRLWGWYRQNREPPPADPYTPAANDLPPIDYTP